MAYGAFIVPGLITASISNASFGVYFPKFTGAICELLSAPVSTFEIVPAHVGAAATKSIVLGLVILATSTLFVPVRVALFNPVVYLISGFRWSFYGRADVGVEASLAASLLFLVLTTEYRLKN